MEAANCPDVWRRVKTLDAADVFGLLVREPKYVH
jgi:hypothetical protein